MLLMITIEYNIVDKQQSKTYTVQKTYKKQ